MYKLSHLITAALSAKDIAYVARLDDGLLDPPELDAKKSLLAFHQKHRTLPSPKLALTIPELQDHVMKTSPLDEQSVIFEDVTKMLIGRLSMRRIAEMQETWDSAGAFPVDEMLRMARYLSGISTETRESLHLINRDEIYAGIDESTAIDFGFDVLDRQVGGIMPGEMAIIAARPGVGKTMILCHEAVRWARQGKRVLVVSLEMKVVQMIHRIDAILGGFDSRIFRERGAAGKLMDLRKRVNDELSIIQDDGGDIIFPMNRAITIGQLETEINDVKPDVVVVDGIYLVRAGTDKNASWEKTKEVSNRLKQLSMDANDGRGVPILASTQLKRGTTGDAGSLEDMAYSDSLGQDADAVFYASKSADSVGGIDIEIVKARYGESMGLAQLKIDWSDSTVTESLFKATPVHLGAR